MGRTDKFRVIWQENPSTAVIIGWNQVSGYNPVLLMDVNDFGKNAGEYGVSKRPDRIQKAQAMNNHFVHLEGLIPNTTYYFLIKDNEGVSRRMFFTTAPNNPNQRLAIIAGGDSRNHRDARQDANLLVAKLRPHCVMFGGDFTEHDIEREWLDWFDDWQLTISSDGRMTPIIVTRGNHEESNQSLIDLFDLKFPQAYYALNLGGNLVRIYTLNTLMPVGGDQAVWLENDLRSHDNVTWKIAQYHYPMRPHTARKSERNDQVAYWAPLFYKYNMNLVVECDAHVVKSTYPVRPDNGPGSDEGFTRDEDAGTVFVGEGCWGAPLRTNDDDKTWTRASGSFNQFNWIFIDRGKIEVRIIKTDGAERVADIDPQNIFKAPRGLVVWSPPTGDVITIANPESGVPGMEGEMLASRGGITAEPPAHPVVNNAASNHVNTHLMDETADWEACPQIVADGSTGDAMIKYQVQRQGNIVIRVINQKSQEVTRIELRNQPPKEYLKPIKTGHLPSGKYLAIVKDESGVLQRYRLLKK
jgi:hypothetical protein